MKTTTLAGEITNYAIYMSKISSKVSFETSFGMARIC